MAAFLYYSRLIDFLPNLGSTWVWWEGIRGRTQSNFQILISLHWVEWFLLCFACLEWKSQAKVWSRREAYCRNWSSTKSMLIHKCKSVFSLGRPHLGSIRQELLYFHSAYKILEWEWNKDSVLNFLEARLCELIFLKLGWNVKILSY